MTTRFTTYLCPISLALRFVAAAALTLGAAACGDSGSGDAAAPAPPAEAPPAAPPPPSTAVTLSGTAAADAALAGGRLKVIDRNGTSRALDGTIGSNGTFSLDVAGLTPPLLVVAEGRIGESTGELFALQPTAATGSGLTVNVTPITSAITALLAPGVNPRAFTQPAQLAAVTASQVDQAVAALNTALANTYAAAGIGAGFNPMSTPFSIGQAGQARLLDAIRFDITTLGVTLTNVTLPLAADGSPPSGAVITLSPSNLQAPPVMTAGGGALALDFLGMLRQPMNDCFAATAAQRATSAACTALFDAAYLGDGYTAAQRWLSADASMDGAVFAVPELLYVHTDPSDGSVLPVVRYVWTRSDGDFGARIDVLKNVGTAAAPQWRLRGNQRDIDILLEPRLARYVERNPARAASQYLTQLRVRVNLAGPRGDEIARVRISGPGYPASGVLYARSIACGTNDYMAIHNDTGGTADWTTQTQNNYSVSYANVDAAQPLAWPVGSPTSRDSPMTPAELTAVRPGALYRWEVWFRDPATKVIAALPVTYVSALNMPLPTPELGGALPWSVPADATLGALLQPTSPATTTATLDYVRAAGAEPVRGIYLFSAKPDPLFNPPALTNTADPRYGSRLRVLGSNNSLAASATSANVAADALTRGVDFSIGVSLPTCTEAQFAAMTEAGAYREIGISSVMPSGLRRLSLFWYSQ